jgi:isocitrate dehydrogenase
MKMTEGLLKRTFEEIATEYPEFETGHVVVDNCAHQLVKKPEQFDVLVMTNMNGDVLSDLSSALIGGLGFAPGVNYGDDVLIFEAVHGSAPKYTGKDVINPTAMLLSGMMMLRFLNEFKAADIIEEALFYTLQEGKVMPRDVVGEEKGCKTSAFGNAVIENMGKKCDAWTGRDYKSLNRDVMKTLKAPVVPSEKLVGVDIFIESSGDIKAFGDDLSTKAQKVGFTLKVVACRGSQVYPSTGTTPQLVPHLQCRFMKNGDMSDEDVMVLLNHLSPYRWMHIEKLRTFDEKMGFSKFQGES